VRGGKYINLFAAALLSSAAFPSWALTGAAFDLDFQNGRYYGGTPSTLLTCTRASTKYAKTSAGALVQFPANTLAITDLGLLIEEARTNTALNSVDLTNTTYWITTNSTVAATSAVTDPTGGTGAFLWNEGSAVTVGHNIIGGASQTMSYTTGTIYCQSAFYKAGTKSIVQMTFGATVVSGSVYANFDLAAGTVAATGGTGLLGSGIEAYGNGWYRVWIAAAATATAASSTNGLIGIPNTAATRSPAYTGTNGTLYTWGWQMETLPAGGGANGPSSYIPTTTASATRNGDNIGTAGVLNTLLGVTGRSAVVSFGPLGWSPAATVVGITLNSAGSNSLPTRIATNTTAGVRANSIDTVATLGSGTFSASVVKVGTSWDGSGDSAVANNGTVVTSANVMTASASQKIGSLNGTTNFINGYMRRATFWNSRLADATLKGFTL
jgi:hypothetical protein